MWWIKDITVTKGTTRNSPVETVANVPLGTIERVLIFFPPGCLGYVKATLWVQEHQFLPENPAGYITGDDYVFDMPMDKEIKDKAEVVKVVTWNTAVTYDHTITVGIFARESLGSKVSQAVKSLFGMAGQTVEIE